MTQEYVIQRKGAVISEGENSFVPEESLRAAEYRLIGNTPDAKASQSSLDSLSNTVSGKANSSDVYSKSEINSTVYSKSEVNSLLSNKADNSTVNSIQSTVNNKANQSDLNNVSGRVSTIEGIKLLKQEIDKLNNRIKELENGRDSDVEHD